MHPAVPSTVIELRRYVMRPGRRDELIALFDAEFVEPLEAAGMHVLGQFRDIDAPDLFVWLRGFADMQKRRHSLEAFYGGALWAARRTAANATMADSDDVHLLRPAWKGAGLPEPYAERGDIGARPPGMLVATIFTLAAPADPALLAECRTLAPLLADAGVLARGVYITEPAHNDFPRLPVHEGVHVVVELALFADADAAEAFERSASHAALHALFAPRLAAAPQRHRLLPTARSALHA
jgi:hypothetical protein